MTDAPKSVGVKMTTGYATNYWGVLTHVFDDGAVEYIRADLADAEIESLRLSLSEARATGRREGLSEAARIADEHAEYIEGVGKKHPEDSPSRDRCFARAISCLAVAAAIRAAMEKAE